MFFFLWFLVLWFSGSLFFYSSLVRWSNSSVVLCFNGFVVQWSLSFYDSLLEGSMALVWFHGSAGFMVLLFFGSVVHLFSGIFALWFSGSNVL